MPTQQQLKLQYAIVSFPNLGLNYWSIPKCGNTTLKYHLLQLDDPETFNRFNSGSDDIKQWVHKEGVCKYITPKESVSNCNTNFTVLREPIERLMSAYRDFFFKRIEMAFSKNNPFNNAIRKLRCSPSIDGLLDILQQFDEANRNIHFRSQSHFLKDEHRASINTYRLESIEDNQHFIHPKLVLKIRLHQTNRSIQEELSEIQKSRILTIYSEDSELWENAL